MSTRVLKGGRIALRLGALAVLVMAAAGGGCGGRSHAEHPDGGGAATDGSPGDTAGGDGQVGGGSGAAAGAGGAGGGAGSDADAGLSCGSQKACVTAGVCIPATGCCDGNDCPAQASGKMGTCDTGSHTCSYDCDSDQRSCNGACIPTAGCCVDSDCSGVCQKCGTDHRCGSVTVQDDPSGHCSGTCDAAGACKSKQGQHCTTASAKGCIGSTPCVDGYCCDSTCGTSCMACDLSGSEGKCSPVPSGPPHGTRSACVGTGTACGGACGGRADGTCVYPTGACGTATCSGTDKVIAQGSCSGGMCTMPAAQTCPNNYACTAGTCKTRCQGDDDCQEHSFCSAGTCNPIVPVDIAAGQSHACVLLSDGTIRCWGANDSGQFANPTAGTSSLHPVPAIGITGAIGIGAGGGNTCAILADTTVKCWGRNDFGQLGVNTSSSPSSIPTQVLNVTGALKLSLASNDACAAITGGTLKCWGDADGLGNGPALDDPSSPVTLPTVTNVGAFALTDGHGCAVNAGDFWCWGLNQAGELGLDPSVTQVADSPMRSAASGSSPIGVAVGGGFSCGVQYGGDVLCWGADPARAPDTLDWKSAKVLGITDVTAIAAEVQMPPVVCAVSDGKVYCWGENEDGEVGADPRTTPSTMTPAAVPELSGVARIVAGARFNCALTATNRVWCWGANEFGVLGLDPAGPPQPTGLPPNMSYVPIEITGW